MAPAPDALVDFTQFDDGQMSVLQAQVQAEVSRRRRVAAMPEMIQVALVDYHQSQGEEGGRPSSGEISVCEHAYCLHAYCLHVCVQAEL